MSRLPLLLLTVMMVLVVAAPARATTETASSGGVDATFSYEKHGDFEWRDLHLVIERGGVPAYDGMPKTQDCESPYCAPGAGDSGSGSLKVTDIDGDGEPEVLVDLYTGGAHCCVVTDILRFTGSTYEPVTRNWADPGYTLVAPVGPGAPATFVTADARFAYTFASFAYSWLPVRALTLVGGRWTDVTRLHPEVLRADAARALKTYKKYRNGSLSLGALAGWVADEYRLGKRRTADAFVTHELAAGRLRGSKGWPRRRAFVRSLARHLRAWGYAG